MLDHERTELISIQGGFCVNTVKMELFLFRSWKCMGHEGVDSVLLTWVVAETQGHAPAALSPKKFRFLLDKRLRRLNGHVGSLEKRETTIRRFFSS